MNIFDAIDKNNIEAVKRMIPENKSENKWLLKYINDTGIPRTPLELAANNYNIPIADYLISQGSDVNHQNKETGTTPLIWAASSINTDFGSKQKMIEYLLSKGSDVNLRNNGGYDALDMVLIRSRGSPGFINDHIYISNDRAERNYRVTHSWNILLLLLEHGAIVRKKPIIHSYEDPRIYDLLSDFWKTQVRERAAYSSRFFGSKNLGSEALESIAEEFADDPDLKRQELMYFSHMGSTTKPGEFVVDRYYLKNVKELKASEIILYTKENKNLTNDSLYKKIEPIYSDIFDRKEIYQLINLGRSVEPSEAEEFLYSKGYTQDTIDYVEEFLKTKPSKRLAKQKLQGTILERDLDGLLELL